VIHLFVLLIDRVSLRVLDVLGVISISIAANLLFSMTQTPWAWPLDVFQICLLAIGGVALSLCAQEAADLIRRIEAENPRIGKTAFKAKLTERLAHQGWNRIPQLAAMAGISWVGFVVTILSWWIVVRL
jgi:hypothetical protein